MTTTKHVVQAALLFCAACQVPSQVPVDAANGRPGYERRALIVGVADYQQIEPLQNTLNDARLIADVLQSIGFKLHGGAPLLDPNAAVLKQQVGAFLGGLDKNTEAVIYFAGHGVQAGGDNLLLPRDFRLLPDADQHTVLKDARSQCVVLSEMLATLEESQASLAVLFLDCCRNPGFLLQAPGVIETKGLHSPAFFEGEILVGFSAKHGQNALDGEGKNSPYTEALAKLLRVPGLSVNTILQRVAASVKASTDNRQQPYFYGNLQNEVYLAGDPVDARALGAGAAPGVGAPETIAKMLSEVSVGQEPERFHRLLGSPNRSKAPGPNMPAALLYESWNAKQFGLQTWYRKREGKWELVAYVLHQHDARAVPVFRGREENTLFVLGRSTPNEIRKRHGGYGPKSQHKVLGRYSGTAYNYYFGRAGGYWHYLIPAKSGNGDAAIHSYGAVHDDRDPGLLDLISNNVIEPMSWSEDNL